MTTAVKVRTEMIFRPHEDLLVRKPTDTATDRFSLISSQLLPMERGFSNADTLGSIPGMYSADRSCFIQPRNLIPDDCKTPRKRSASNSAGLFRPFDTPPKKIRKLSSIYSENNVELSMNTCPSGEAHSDVYQNDLKKILKSNDHLYGAKSSIFRTVDQLATSSQSKPIPAPVQESMQRQFACFDNFCTSTPVTSHRKIIVNPYNSLVEPLTFDAQENFWNQSPSFDTPTNMSVSRANQLASLVRDTPPYTPANVVRPKPHRLLEAPPQSNLYREGCGLPFSAKINDFLHSHTALQFNVDINASYPPRRDFKISNSANVQRVTQDQPNPNTILRMSEIDNSHDCLYATNPIATNEHRAYLDFKMPKPTPHFETSRSAAITENPNSPIFSKFHSGEHFLSNIADEIKEETSVMKSSNPGVLQQQQQQQQKQQQQQRQQPETPDQKHTVAIAPLDDRFECRICQKVFSQQRLLDRHAKRHGGVKGCICAFCGKGFSDAFDLKRHVRTHTGVRPFKCEDCGKAFTQRGSLELHKSNVHKRQLGYAYKQRRNKVYVCEECGHSEDHEDEYRTHVELHHKDVVIFSSESGTKRQ